MFDIGWSEILVIAVVALVVIGPKELPAVIRGLGQTVAKLRRMAAEFQGQFNEALREAELTDLKKSVDDIRSIANPLQALKDEVRHSIETAATGADAKAPQNTPAPPAGAEPEPPLDLAPPAPPPAALAPVTTTTDHATAVPSTEHMTAAPSAAADTVKAAPEAESKTA
jgi:sec-independent protein translocase protein TatB